METQARQQRLLQGINLRETTGLEIGPLYTPLVTKNEGTVYYVDHLDTAGLLAKYEQDPNVDTSLIVPVDFVSNGELRACIPSDLSFDYIVASHVIEHVPDMITWLNDIERLLEGAGSLCLVVPDRRFTFDYIRTETELSQVLGAYGAKYTYPQAQALADFLLKCAPVDATAAWRGQIKRDALKYTFTVEGVLDLVRDASANGTYHDGHMWVFTPRSFALLMAQLVEANLIHWKCELFVDTAEFEIEFSVRLSPCADVSEAIASWHAMANAAHDGTLKPNTPEPSQLLSLRPKLGSYKRKAKRRVRKFKRKLVSVGR